MKKFITSTLLLLFVLIQFNSHAQEKYGRTLNLGLCAGGYAGYNGYAGRILPVFSMNYEIDVARNFTLAPFISFYTFSERNGAHRYHETVVPIGVKSAYYFDELLQANSDWDFYLGGSLGFAIVNSRWDEGYTGDRNYYHGGSALFLDLHIGSEYHFSKSTGVFLDLSTGVSTIGLAFHGIK